MRLTVPLIGTGHFKIAFANAIVVDYFEVLQVTKRKQMHCYTHTYSE